MVIEGRGQGRGRTEEDGTMATAGAWTGSSIQPNYNYSSRGGVAAGVAEWLSLSAVLSA